MAHRGLSSRYSACGTSSSHVDPPRKSHLKPGGTEWMIDNRLPAQELGEGGWEKRRKQRIFQDQEAIAEEQEGEKKAENEKIPLGKGSLQLQRGWDGMGSWKRGKEIYQNPRPRVAESPDVSLNYCREKFLHVCGLFGPLTTSQENQVPGQTSPQIVPVYLTS